MDELTWIQDLVRALSVAALTEYLDLSSLGPIVCSSPSTTIIQLAIRKLYR